MEGTEEKQTACRVAPLPLTSCHLSCTYPRDAQTHTAPRTHMCAPAALHSTSPLFRKGLLACALCGKRGGLQAPTLALPTGALLYFLYWNSVMWPVLLLFETRCLDLVTNRDLALPVVASLLGAVSRSLLLKPVASEEDMQHPADRPSWLRTLA